MFLDKVTITCKAGNGGDGKVYFRREKFVPCGGPEGGDGGNGGNIIFKSTKNMSNLSEFRFTKMFKAENGENGGNSNCNGKNGKNTTILVPVGTVIKNAKTNKVIADLYESDMEFLALKGGRGGRGNARFVTATRQAPKFSETGEIAHEFPLVLELKTIADVGLIGYPNVGKSSLLAAVSNAKPKIANYHFTTLAPNIGVVSAYNVQSVWADIPGLIEGASDGVGLGHDFLRHIERTRLLLHVIDASGSEGRNPIEDYKTINHELKNYSKKVANTPQIIVLNKIDLMENPEKEVKEICSKLPKDAEVYAISAGAYIGVKELVEGVAKKLTTLPMVKHLEIEESNIDKRNKLQFEVVQLQAHVFEVKGELVDEIARGVILDDMRSFAYFQNRIKDQGIIAALLNAGMKEGDTVIFSDVEFEYTV